MFVNSKNNVLHAYKTVLWSSEVSQNSMSILKNIQVLASILLYNIM